MGNLIEHDDEFVSAKPGHHVAIAYAIPKPLGHLDQQRVTCRVPQRVVDHLESIEVNEQHRAFMTIASRQLDRPLK